MSAATTGGTRVGSRGTASLLPPRQGRHVALQNANAPTQPASRRQPLEERTQCLDGGGIESQLRAESADHLLFIGEEEIRALAGSGTVAVIRFWI